MKSNTLLLALATATALPASAHAADDFCSRIFIYAINQICQQMPNSQSLCQPIGLAGPAPGCNTTNAQPLVQVPLGPPAIQMSAYSPFVSAPNPYAPFPFAPNPFTSFPSVPNPYAPMAAYSPPSSPPPLMQPATAMPLKPAAVAAAPSAGELTELMPATASTDKATAVASAALPVLAAVPAPKTPEPLIKSAAAAASVAAVPATTGAANALASPAVAPMPASLAPKAPEVVAEAPSAGAPATASPALVAVEIAKPVIAKPVIPNPVIASEQNKDAHENALAHFEFDSAELTAAGRAMLDTWLGLAAGDQPIQVTGHADRLGPEPYNEKLSLQRAEAVKKYLTEKGKPARRIHILAKGETMPVIRCAGDANPETKACLAPNRRAEIAVGAPAKTASKSVTKKMAKPAIKRVVRPVKPRHSK